MNDALTLLFTDYARDSRRSNTVPGQFRSGSMKRRSSTTEMMHSPWFPPRYVWAAIEGAAGLSVLDGPARVEPRMASDWKWCGASNLPIVANR